MGNLESLNVIEIDQIEMEKCDGGWYSTGVLNYNEVRLDRNSCQPSLEKSNDDGWFNNFWTD